jgi:peptidyl-prolyl cis-trans isomerase D
MMDSMRRHASGWVAKILIGLLVLSFAVWGINDVFRGANDDAVATVGEQKVTSAAFQQQFENQLRQLSRQTGQTITPDQARQFGLDRQILSEMVRDAALRQKSTDLKLVIPNDLIVQEIAANPAFQNAKGEFDPGALREILQANGISEPQFLANEAANRLRQVLADAVSANVKVPDALVEAALRNLNETRDARYFVLNTDPAKVAEPQDADVQKFYDENQPTFTAPAYRSVALMTAEPADLAPGMTVTPDELNAAYERRKEEYGTPERRLLQQLTFPSADEATKALARIRAGEDFLAIAKERGVTEQDATLGEVTRNTLPDPALAEAAFALAEGAVSEPVQGRLAIALVRVTKIVPGTQQTLDEVRADVEQKLKLDKAKDEILVLHDKVEDARAGGASFDEIANDLKLTLTTIPAVDAKGLGKDGKPLTPAIAAPVLQAAFESDEGVENDAVATPTEGFAWFEVREVIPSAVRPLDEVRADAVAAWKKRELRKLALDNARALSERAAKGESFDALATESTAEIKTVSGLKRSAKDETFDGPALSALFGTADKAAGFAPRSDGASAIIFEAGTLQSPAFDGTSEQAKAIRAELARAQANDLFAMYMANLQLKLGVNVNAALWAQMSGNGG